MPQWLDEFSTSAWALGAVAVGAALLYGLLRALAFLIRVAPISNRRRLVLARVLWGTGAIATILFLFWSASTVFGGQPQLLLFTIAIIGFVTIASSWVAIRDIGSGVVARMTQLVQVGDEVHIGDISGTVDALNSRSLVVSTPAGESAVVPYTYVLNNVIRRTRSDEQTATRTFQLDIPASQSIPAARTQIVTTALNHHWSAVGQAPKITSLDAQRLEVTVYALDADRAPEIEREIRSQLESLSS